MANPIGTWEIWAIGAFVLAVAAQGLLAGGRAQSLRNYFVTDGSVPWYFISISLYASLLTPMSFIGVVSWIAQKDSRWFVGSALVGLLSLPLAAAIWVTLWHRLRPLTIFEYLESRYTPWLRVFGVILFLSQMIFWLGNELVTTAGILETSFGLAPIGSIGLVMLVGTAYTLLGGARADIWTEQTQFVVLVGAFLCVLAVLLLHFNFDVEEVHRLASSKSTVTGHLHTTMVSTEFDFGVEGALWAIIFVRLNNVLMFGTEQVVVQRLLAIPRRSRMFLAIVGFGVIDVVVAALLIITAWALIAFFAVGPHQGGTAASEKLLVIFTTAYAPEWLRMFVICGLLSALLSSYGTGLNSVSGVIINDVYRRFVRRTASDLHYLLASRVVVVLVCLVLFAFARWQYGHQEVTVLQRMGQYAAVIGGPIGCLFVLGMFFRRVNTTGAVFGASVALLFALLFNGIPGVLKPTFNIFNWMWISGIGTILGMVCGYIGSLPFKPPGQLALKGLLVRDSA